MPSPEIDLEDDDDLEEQQYLYDLVDRAPMSSFIIKLVREQTTYKGFCEFAISAKAKNPDPDMLTKDEVESRLDAGPRLRTPCHGSMPIHSSGSMPGHSSMPGHGSMPGLPVHLYTYVV